MLCSSSSAYLIVVIDVIIIIFIVVLVVLYSAGVQIIDVERGTMRCGDGRVLYIRGRGGAAQMPAREMFWL